MEICVLGPGCPKCTLLEKLVRDAVAELKIDGSIEKVNDIERMLSYGVMMTPALVVDNEVLFSGFVPTSEEIKQKLTEKMQK